MVLDTEPTRVAIAGVVGGNGEDHGDQVAVEHLSSCGDDAGPGSRVSVGRRPRTVRDAAEAVIYPHVVRVVAAGYVTGVPQLDDEVLAGVYLLHLGEVELGRTTIFHVGVDPDVAETRDIGFGAAGAGAKRVLVSAFLRIAVLDHDSQRVDSRPAVEVAYAELLVHRRRHVVPHRGQDGGIGLIETLPARVPAWEIFGPAVSRFVADRAQQLIAICGVERGGIGAVQHEPGHDVVAAAHRTVPGKLERAATVVVGTVEDLDRQSRSSFGHLDAVEIPPLSINCAPIRGRPLFGVRRAAAAAAAAVAQRRVAVTVALRGIGAVDAPPQTLLNAERGVVAEVGLGTPKSQRQYVAGNCGALDRHRFDPKYLHEVGRNLVGDGRSELGVVFDGVFVVGEVDDLDDVGPAERFVEVPVGSGDRQSLLLGLVRILCGIHHPGKGSGVGAVLDLDAVPVDPAEVDGEAGRAHEHDEEQGHQGEDGAPLARQCIRELRKTFRARTQGSRGAVRGLGAGRTAARLGGSHRRSLLLGAMPTT